MSPRSLDPISRRPDKPDGKSGSSRKSSEKKSDDIILPNAADREKLLEKAQASIQEKKNKKAASRRKKIIAGVLILFIVFIAGASLIGLNRYRQDQQVRQSNEKKKEILDKLAKFDVVKNLTNDQKDELYRKVGAKYLAAEKIGIQPSPDSTNDQGTISFLNGLNGNNADAVSKAFDTMISQKLELVKTTGYYEGYQYKYWYANTALVWPSTFPIPNKGDAAALEADKKYALDTATADKKRLEASSVKPQDLLKELSANRRLSIWEDPNGSGPISSVKTVAAVSPINTYPGASAVPDAIKAMTSVGYSDIGKLTYVSVYDPKKTPVEAGYFFIQMTKYVKGQAAVDMYNQALAETQRQIK